MYKLNLDKYLKKKKYTRQNLHQFYHELATYVLK